MNERRGIHMKKLENLLDNLPFQYHIMNDAQVTITSITTDSREVTKGAMFVAIKGFTVDGHDYIDQAIKKGASAILTEREMVIADESIALVRVNQIDRVLSYLVNDFYDYPTNALHMIGITGTNGKTSITYLLEKIFKQNNERTGLIGTIQMKIGEDTYPIKNTTPEPSFLFNSFHKMQLKQIDQCIMEVSSHALEEGRVRGVDFDIAVFTNLSQDHLDFHDSMEAYKLAKMRLFYQLGNRYESEKKKYAIINADDAFAFDFIHATSQPVVTYGLTESSDVYAKDIQLSAKGTVFNLVCFSEEVTIKTSLIGKFNVYNMLAAIATAKLSGVPLAVIKEALSEAEGTKGRFEAVKTESDRAVIVDYAHTPDSLRNVLETIRTFAKGKIICIVGCGGDRDKAKRPLMANVSDRLSDFTILTSDNPRSEDPLDILKDMEVGIESNDFIVEIDRKKAIEKAIDRAQKDDVILIAGKGHETYQLINGVSHPFDDYEIAKKYLNDKAGEKHDNRSAY